MCEHCKPFEAYVTIAGSQKLETLHRHLFFDGVRPGVLEILSGSLQWSDSMQCTLRCVYCKQHFELECEKNGIGEFGPLPTRQEGR